MAIRERRQRERAERERSIVVAARELAETEGWEAVTTRRLAERIEYSQPVLYGHFPSGKEAIVAAVALDGFTELTATVRRAVDAKSAPRDAVTALAGAYLSFATAHPAVYDAMFDLDTPLAFADPDTPAPLGEAFAVLLDVLTGVAGPCEPGLFTEVVWAALHGLVTLTRAGRLPAEHTAARLEVLVDRLLRT